MNSRIEQRSEGDLRPEYDFASMNGGIRGKYYTQYCKETNTVRLDTNSRSFDSAPDRPQQMRSKKYAGASLRMTKFRKNAGTPA